MSPSPKHSGQKQRPARGKNKTHRDGGIAKAFRIGFGNDVHQLVAGKKLIVGGASIVSSTGPRAHSDGDALIHAVSDALLGAAALGDIGHHFPDTSPRWRNASSVIFLRQVRRLLTAAGYAVVNIDATVSLERPKLRPHIAAIERNLARALGLRTGQVSVKAKTGEGLDAVGRGQAIRADAVALIQAIR